MFKLNIASKLIHDPTYYIFINERLNQNRGKESWITHANNQQEVFFITMHFMRAFTQKVGVQPLLVFGGPSAA
jgi:hypothetical protein